MTTKAPDAKCHLSVCGGPHGEKTTLNIGDTLVNVDVGSIDGSVTKVRKIGHVHEYPTMHHFGNPRHIQSMIAYMTLTEYFWKFH